MDEIEEIQKKVREYDPRSLGKRTPLKVFAVWRSEKYESPTLVALCYTVEAAKKEAENAARKWDRMFKEWYEKPIGDGTMMKVADVDDRLSYTITEEEVK